MVTTFACSRPSRSALTVALAEMLGSSVVITRRLRNAYASTYLSEMVWCRLAENEERTVLCKYGAGPVNVVYGHKGGVVYEAEVYRQMLQPLQGRTTLAAFHGAHTDPASGCTWLVLEYLDNSARLHQTADPNGALIRASAWAGAFHALTERMLASQQGSCLNVYTRDYYRGWAQRAAEYAGALHQRFQWLRSLCERFEEEGVPLLLDRPRSVIHGEYYPKNVLTRDEAVYPVDWESAAMGAGEIDLATLTEGWPAEVTLCCEEAYAQSRWPDAVPADFSRILTAARIYGLLRWLGDSPELTTKRGSIERFTQLGQLGEQLGVI